jgi:putative transposase
VLRHLGNALDRVRKQEYARLTGQDRRFIKGQKYTLLAHRRRHTITETTFHRWRRKYGGLQIPEARRLKALEEENRQLKRLVADQALNLQVVKDLLGKRW